MAEPVLLGPAPRRTPSSDPADAAPAAARARRAGGSRAPPARGSSADQRGTLQVDRAGELAVVARPPRAARRRRAPGGSPGRRRRRPRHRGRRGGALGPEVRQLGGVLGPHRAHGDRLTCSRIPPGEHGRGAHPQCSPEAPSARLRSRSDVATGGACFPESAPSSTSSRSCSVRPSACCSATGCRSAPASVVTDALGLVTLLIAGDRRRSRSLDPDLSRRRRRPRADADRARRPADRRHHRLAAAHRGAARGRSAAGCSSRLAGRDAAPRSGTGSSRASWPRR